MKENKLIAEFMYNGVPPLWTSPSYLDGKFWVSEKFQGIENPDGNDLLTTSEMKFHSDWNWLMKVVDKIENLQYKNNNYVFKVVIDYSSCYVYDMVNDEIITELSRGSKIEAVYDTCVNFIKWHNESNDKL